MSYDTLKNSLRKIPALFSSLKFLKHTSLNGFHSLESFLLVLYTRQLCRKYCLFSWQHEKREKPHLLLLTDFNLPAGYTCDTARELWELSLAEANITTFTRLTFPTSLYSKIRFIRKLFNVCSLEKPDYLFLALGGNPVIFPPPHCWDLLCKTMSVPFFALLADSLPHFLLYLEQIQCLAGVISIDAQEPCRNNKILAEKSYFMPSPVCQSVFYNRNDTPRNILVSFMGLTVNQYAYRADIIAQIQKKGIPIHAGGGYTQRVPLQKMAEIYRNSLCVVNFSGKPDRIVQCKGRVVEATLCGACLIEFNNPETNHWLRPDVDYAAYNCMADIPDKIQFLLDHPDILEQIRQSGAQRAQSLFGATKTWNCILDFARKHSASAS